LKKYEESCKNSEVPDGDYNLDDNCDTNSDNDGIEY
jgi:hypothetical protein